ncbi:MAG: serine protease, partial [Chloroflexota bacterium]|nr:serine protease [Chloroflexota bacterium]
MKITLLKLLAALVLALCAACGSEPSEESVPKEPTPSIEDAPVEDTVLGKSVLKKVAPSMVTIQFRGADSGSGFLVDGNYIVTAAHVVWGKPGINVLDDDGTLHETVPIAGYDYFTDLAFLGPVDTSSPTLEFGEIDSLTVEDTAYIIGDPRGPGGISVSEGKFHSKKDWPEANATIVYASATGKLGMSGGPIANGSGEVMGVLVRGRGEELSWGPSSGTVKDRLEKLGRGDAITVLGHRDLPNIREGSREHRFLLRDQWDTATFVSKGSTHTIEFDSYRDVEYGFFDINGVGAFRPDFRTVQDGLTDRCCITGPGFIEVKQRFDIERQVTLKSATPLVRRTDPDDGRLLRFGETIAGVIDTPGDIDRYTIDLFGGESVAIRIFGLNRMLVTIEYDDAPPYDIGSDEVYFDEIKYRAPINATYTVTLQMNPREFSHPLGYTLTALDSTWYLKRRDDSVVLDSPVGDMLRHNFGHDVPTIQIDYPANITGGNRQIIAAELFEQDRRGRTVTLEKRDLSHHRQEPDEELSVADYMERSVLSGTFPYK